MQDDDALLGFFLFGVGIFLIAVRSLLLATVYIAVLSTVSYIHYWQYLAEAEDEFDEIVQEAGVDLSTEEILMSVGVEVPGDPEFNTVTDWMTRVPRGVVLLGTGLTALAMGALVASARGKHPCNELRRRIADIGQWMRLSSNGNHRGRLNKEVRRLEYAG